MWGTGVKGRQSEGGKRKPGKTILTDFLKPILHPFGIRIVLNQ